jgi:hypothetical protein
MNERTASPPRRHGPAIGAGRHGVDVHAHPADRDFSRTVHVPLSLSLKIRRCCRSCSRETLRPVNLRGLFQTWLVTASYVTRISLVGIGQKQTEGALVRPLAHRLWGSVHTLGPTSQDARRKTRLLHTCLHGRRASVKLVLPFAVLSRLFTQVATTRPPAARMTSPVIQADSSDARNTASGAISVTRPSRPSGVLPARTAPAPPSKVPAATLPSVSV